MTPDPSTATLPRRWTWKKLKHVARMAAGDAITSDDIRETGDYPVYGGNGLRGYTDQFNRKGEFVLIGRQGALCGNINYASGEFWASEHAIVADLQDDTEVRWLGELLTFMNLNQYSQSAAQPGIAVDVISNLPIPVPPRTAQRAIARFLDRETADIDALIAAKQLLLDLLAEKRRAIVAEAIMRGLNPAAPLRPSGIDWLGDIPAHWEMKRSKWLFQERDERSTDGSEVLLSLRMERGLVPHNDVSEKLTRPEELIGYKKTSVGQLVVNRMRAATGLIAITTQDGLVSPDYAVFWPSPEISADYYVHMFKTPLLQAVFRSESTGLGTGSQGFLRLYSENFLALWFPYPPLDEQREIVRHIATETAKIDRLRAATEHSIALLKERRRALIAAAVTGQIDIPEAA